MNIDKSIEEVLAVAEEKRLKRKKGIRLLYLICWSLFAIGLYIYFYGDFLFEGNFTYLLYLFGLAFALLTPIVYPIIKPGKISGNLKEQIVIPIILDRFPDITYNQDQFISKSEFLNSGLYPSSDRYSGEDFFMGQSKFATYKFSQICAENVREKSNSDGSSRLHITTVFKGIFMVVKLDVKLQSETCIYSYGGKGLFSGFSKVQLGYREFDNLFEAYTKDEAEAKLILTKKMIQGIVKLREDLDKSIYMAFKGSNVYVGIRSSDNFFDIDTDEEINVEQIKRIIQEIETTVCIPDQLELNKND